MGRERGAGRKGEREAKAVAKEGEGNGGSLGWCIRVGSWVPREAPGRNYRLPRTFRAKRCFRKGTIQRQWFPKSCPRVLGERDFAGPVELYFLGGR